MCCDNCIYNKSCDYYDEIIKPLVNILDRPKDIFLINLQECLENNFVCDYKETAEGASMAT